MALIELKIRIYKPRYPYPHLSTMTEFQKEEYINKQVQDAYEEEDELEVWLEEHYSMLEIYKMNKSDRQKVDEAWRASCREYKESCFADDYDEEEVILRIDEEELNSHESFRLLGID